MARKTTMSQEKNPSQNDISKLKSIKNISKKYKKRNELLEDIGELRQILGAQELNNKKLVEKLKEKDDEIKHLKTLLKDSVPVVGNIERIEIQEEELIAEMQLQKLKNISQKRDLTLEEARKFEIYSKVKNSANRNRPMVPQYTHLPDNTPKKDLLQIASNRKIESKGENES